MSTCNRVIPIAKAALAADDAHSHAFHGMQQPSDELAGKEGFGLPDSVKVRHEKLDQLNKDYP
ncbi:MAG: hypothetical protein EBZ42_12165, partial [Betaproteobacteria bacterium]|nr:hypothetical protein [Betaproteobacteria bacterium]